MKRLVFVLLVLFVLPCASSHGAKRADSLGSTQSAGEKSIVMILPFTQDYPVHMQLV